MKNNKHIYSTKEKQSFKRGLMIGIRKGRQSRVKRRKFKK